MKFAFICVGLFFFYANLFFCKSSFVFNSLLYFWFIN